MIEWKYVWNETYAEFLRLLKAPLLKPEMWWIITPLIIITILMTFYFGKYIREKLGWNTALGNCITLFFVGLDLMRNIYNYTEPASWLNYLNHPAKTIIIGIVLLEAILLSYTAYKHAVREWFMFLIASPISVNTQAYLLIAIVYGKWIESWFTLSASIMLFLCLVVILKSIQEIEHWKLGYHKLETAWFFRKKRKRNAEHK